jgi:hypothetical protein
MTLNLLPGIKPISTSIRTRSKLLGVVKLTGHYAVGVDTEAYRAEADLTSDKTRQLCQQAG